MNVLKRDRSCDVFTDIRPRCDQDGCGFSAPKAWRNFDASPTLRFEKLPIIGKVIQKNPSRFPGNVEHGDIEATPTYNKNKQVLLYAGKYNKFVAVDTMAEALSRVKAQDIEIWLCGKGDDPSIRRLCDNDFRVKKLGFVSNDELHRLHLKADLFLNLRPADIVDNIMIFPSKILNYLSYGKPVVSSWTAGLSPEYRRFLQVPENDTPESIAEKIDEVFSWPQTKRIKYKNNVRSWFKASRTWDMQARRLGELLENKVL